MPRLSLYKPEKGPDFRFLDRVINEQFQVGGTDIFVHKYIGSGDPAAGQATPTVAANTKDIKELGIQDVLFMENRDRKYDPDVYIMRGIYTMQDLDFNLSQFGLFLTNDNIMVHFHLRNTVDTLTRKIMPGDVLELPHLKDEYALDDSLVALKRFYVVTDVSRPANGFSQTWYPHLLRAKCQPLVDSQEFSDILNQDSGAGDGSTLKDLLSTYNTSIEINNKIVEEAELDAPVSGYNTYSFYVLSRKESGLINNLDVSNTLDDVSLTDPATNASVVLYTPSADMYIAYGSGDDRPPNSPSFEFGNAFPSDASEGDFYLRTDYQPDTLYRYNGKHWVMYEKNVRMTMNQFGAENVALGKYFAGRNIRLTLKTSFINNTSTFVVNGETIPEKQALSKALKPKADN